MKYDGFISYSQKTDNLIAPQIQNGLQKLAKPILKTKALNIFRDQTNISASPELWIDIKKALENSHYLIYLASPKAVASKWVKRELIYWLEEKSIKKLVIVLTDGEIMWDENTNDFNWEITNALPDFFSKSYEHEPFIVNFKELKSQENLSLLNPRFKDNIAKIAARIHEKEYNEIVGTDISIRRRIRFLVATISLTLVILTLLSNYFRIQSNENRIKADKSAIKSEANALNSSALLTNVKNPTEGMELAKKSYSLNKKSNNISKTISDIFYSDIFEYDDNLYSTPFYNEQNISGLCRQLPNSMLHVNLNNTQLSLFNKNWIKVDSVNTNFELKEIVPIDSISFLTYNYEGKIYKWRIKDGKIKKDLNFYFEKKQITSINSHPKGKYIFIGSEDGKVSVLANSKILFTTDKICDLGVYDIHFSSSGKNVLFTSNNFIFHYEFKNDELKHLAKCKIQVKDGKRGFNPYFSRAIFFGNNYILAGLNNGFIHLYDLKGKRLLSKQAHEKNITHLTVDKSNTYFLSASRDKLINLWSLSFDLGLEEYFMDKTTSLLGNKELVYELRYDNTDDIVKSYSYDGSIKTWNLKQNSTQSISLKNNLISPIETVQIYSDSTLLIFSSFNKLLINSVYNRNERSVVFKDTLKSTFKYHFNEENNNLITQTNNNSIAFWKLKDEGFIKNQDFLFPNSVRDFTSCVSEKTLVVTGNYLYLLKNVNNQITIIDSLSGFLNKDLGDLTISPDGSTAIVLIDDEYPIIYNLENNNFKIISKGPFKSRTISKSSITSDGNLILYTFDNGVVILENQNHQYSIDFIIPNDENYFKQVHFSKDSHQIITSNNNGEVELWRGKKGDVLKIKILEDYNSKHPNSRHFVLELKEADFLDDRVFYTLLKKKDYLSFWQYHPEDLVLK